MKQFYVFFKHTCRYKETYQTFKNVHRRWEGMRVGMGREGRKTIKFDDYCLLNAEKYN